MSERPEGSVCVVFRRSMRTADLYTGWFLQVPPIGSTIQYPDRLTTLITTAKVIGQNWQITGNPVLSPVVIVNLIIK